MIFIGCQYIFTISLLYPSLGRGHGPSFKQHDFPSPKDALCQVWLKLAQLFWIRRFFLSLSMYFHYLLLSPLRKGRILHLNKLESPSPKNVLCQVRLKLAHVLENKIFKVLFKVTLHFVICMSDYCKEHNRKSLPYMNIIWR